MQYLDLDLDAELNCILRERKGTVMYGINDQKCSNVLTSQRVHMYSVCTLDAKHMDGYCKGNTCIYIHMHVRTSLRPTQPPSPHSIQFKKQQAQAQAQAPSTSAMSEHMLPTRYAERDTEIHVHIFSSCRSEI